ADPAAGWAAAPPPPLAEASLLQAKLSDPPVRLQVECDRASAQTAQRQGDYKRAEATLEHARHLLEASRQTYLAVYASVLNDLGGVYNETSRPQQALAMT